MSRGCIRSSLPEIMKLTIGQLKKIPRRKLISLCLFKTIIMHLPYIILSKLFDDPSKVRRNSLKALATRKKLPNVYKSCPKMISQEK